MAQNPRPFFQEVDMSLIFTFLYFFVCSWHHFNKSFALTTMKKKRKRKSHIKMVSVNDNNIKFPTSGVTLKLSMPSHFVQVIIAIMTTCISPMLLILSHRMYTVGKKHCKLTARSTEEINNWIKFALECLYCHRKT